MTQSVASPAAQFDAWAEVYDTQPNPLLLLEQRILETMMPDVRGLDVLDAGCGTGRWLQYFADRGARRLVGIDTSTEMLALAAGKLGRRCELVLGSCTALPVAAASADLVLSSFVLSYLENLDAFAREMCRVARPGATIFLADMHPETEAACHWKRSFLSGSTRSHIRTLGWRLEQIKQRFQAQGLKLVAGNEPGFGPQERQIFEECNKLDAYRAALGLPAIYALQFRKPASSPRPRTVVSGGGVMLLTGARCALGPESAAPAALSIVGDRIESIQDESRSHFLGNALDLSGYMLLPGLINAHDHLEFGLYPNIGKGPYENATQWARGIHANWAPLIAQHRKVPRATCLWWGAIRNLLSGVTTVCHHNPVHAELLDPTFPIRVVTEFSWAHSPAFEADLAGKFAQTDLPFILHAAEGVDEASAQDIAELDHIGALNHRTVLVHGLACTPESVALVNKRRASLIMCPTSNKFLFHQTPSLDFIRSLHKVILGSDSPLTAAGDLLDEINFVHQEIGLDTVSLYNMVTSGPADVLRCRQGEGTLKAGSIADLLVVRDVGRSPAETLATLTSQQIELVILGGRVQLAGASLIERLPRSHRQGLQPFYVDGQPRWVRAPIDRLLAEAGMVLGSDLRVGGKRVYRA